MQVKPKLTIASFLLFSSVFSTLVFAVNSDKDKLKQLNGVYASTSLWSCIGTTPPGTFDENLTIQPEGSDSFTTWVSRSTKITYNGDGTGTEVGTAVNVTNTGAVKLEINCDLTYVVNSDQSFDVTKSCADLVKIAGGDDIRYTTVFVENNQMKKEGEVLITTTEEPFIQIFKFTDFGFQNEAICARTGTQIRID